MSIAAEFTNQIALVNTRKRELETPALSTCATIASSINQLTSERKEQNIKVVTDAVLSLIRTDAIYAGQKRALEKLRDEMSAPGAAVMDAQQMEQRLRELSEKESAKAVDKLGDGRASSLFKAYVRDAKLTIEEDDDDGVQMTQGFVAGDLICPLMKSEFVQPMKAKPCFALGATKCVFSKTAIMQLVRSKSGGVPCPQMGCVYTGQLKASDLEPSKEMELMIKRERQRQEREKIRRAGEVEMLDDDALDEDEEVEGNVKGEAVI